VDARREGWQIPRVAANESGTRLVRRALWVLYFAAVLFGLWVLIGSVARQLRGTPRPAPAKVLPTRAALRLCMTDLESLYREQNQRAWELGSDFEGTDPLGAWNAWARTWELQVEDLSARCRLDETDDGEGHRERAEMAAARDAMEALHRAYQAQVNRFAEEEGDLAQAAAEAMAHAREAVADAR
jgi:hypothetical protein